MTILDDELILSDIPFNKIDTYLLEQINAISQEHKQYQILTMLKEIAWYHFCPDAPKEPYKPMVIMDNKRSPIPSDLSLENLEVLEKGLPNIAQNELKARIYDILFLHGDKRQKQSNAKKALEHFIMAINDRFISDNDSLEYVDIPKLLQRCLELHKGGGLHKSNAVVKSHYNIYAYIEEL